MKDLLQIRIYESQQLVFTAEATGPLELGRQDKDEADPYAQNLRAVPARLIIARKDEQSISRKHALVEPLGQGKARLKNLSLKLPIRFGDSENRQAHGSDLVAQSGCEITLPAVLILGNRTVRVQPLADEEPGLQSLADVTRPPQAESASSVPFATLLTPGTAAVDSKALVRWLQTTMGVFQSAASSSDFFQQAARAVVDMVGLDAGRVLLLDNGTWQPHALATAPGVLPQNTPPPSRRVLTSVQQKKRTFWQIPGASGQDPHSLRDVSAIVAAPILGRQGQVLGALYGDRRHAPSSPSAAPITELEAMLVELLASGVAAGLARLEQEQAALTARVQFEQFFTPELSRQLAVHPDLLKGRDCEVSILFCDIRAFSRISERLGPAGTVEWIGDVMGSLSDCVRAHAGVLVDYIGDELMAMWGAPEEQPEHAQLACRAAVEMLHQLPRLNERWQPILKEPLALGIGINTGVARVGNTGSRHKFKYGPLGNTVNLASRVQGATKYLQTKLLITEHTQRRLKEAFPVRRLGAVRVINIAEPVDLYEVVAEAEPFWADLKQDYEKALVEFEKKELRPAARILGNLVISHPDDGPSLVLLSRVVNALVNKQDPFDPVWKLEGK